MADGAPTNHAENEPEAEGPWWERHKYLPPRIDDDRFQAEVDEYSEEIAEEAQIDVESGTLVWDPSCGNPPKTKRSQGQNHASGISEHLVFARSLTEQSRPDWDESGSVPSESDELALRNVTLHGGNIELAQYSILAQFGCGRECNRRRKDSKAPKLEPVTNTLDFRDQPDPREMLYGCLHHGEVEPHPYPKRLVNSSEESPYPLSVDDACEHASANPMVDVPLLDDLDTQSNGAVLQSGRGRGADRAEIKGRWEELLSEATSIIQTASDTESKSGRPHVRRLLNLLDSAASLPIPEQIPGETFADEVQSSLLVVRSLLGECRDWSARVRDALCAKGQAADVQNLHELAERASELSVCPAELEMLETMARKIESWKARALEALESECDESALVALIDEACSTPFLGEQAEYGQLVRKAGAATLLTGRLIEALQPKKQREMEGGRLTWPKLEDLEADLLATKVNLKEGAALRQLMKHIREWCAGAEKAVTETPDLKCLQQLIGAGELLPVSFPVLLEMLQAKLAQAEAWVERVRNAVPQKKTRKNAVTEKVEFGEMKSLLTEVSGMQVDMRERDHMAQVVETAEDWIGRVREAMDAGEESTLAALENLLTEADSIPVGMDEHQLLVCEIKARRWTSDVRETLKATDRGVEVLWAHLDDFEAIRQEMPLDATAKNKFTVEEEARLKEVVGMVQVWQEKVKRAMANKRGTTLVTYQELIDEAAAIPVDLSSYSEPVKMILNKAAIWSEAHTSLIRACLKGSGGEGNGADSKAAVGQQPSDEKISPVTLSALESCLQAAEKVNAAIAEAPLLRDLLEKGKAWLQQAEKLCPKRQTKRSAQNSSEKPTEQAVLDHIALGRDLPIDLTILVDRLSENIQTARTWCEQARAFMHKIASDEEMGDPGEDSSDFPVLDEDIHERLRTLLGEADLLIVKTEEEIIIDRFLEVYAWSLEVSVALDPGRQFSWGMQDLERVTKKASELFLTDQVSVTSLPPLLKNVIFYGESRVQLLSDHRNEVMSWLQAAKKLLESTGGVTRRQAKDLLEKVRK